MSNYSSIPDGFEPIQSSNPFAGGLGPLYEKVFEDGRWLRGFLVEEKHANQAKIVHGGMIMTFADILLARAVMDRFDPPFVTARLTTDFIGPALMGRWVQGQARITGQHDELIFVDGEISSRGHPVASVQGSFKLLRGL